MALKLQVIICSTRPGRMGGSVGHWFADYARAHSDFDVQVVDLAELDLPMYNEPKHPIMQQYEHEHTKNWGASVDSADAYVFVAPEYNYSPTPALVNALNYVYHEWNYKPCGFVSYGGVSGGLRAAQAARLQVTTLKMMPIPEGSLFRAWVPWWIVIRVYLQQTRPLSAQLKRCWASSRYGPKVSKRYVIHATN